MKRIFFPSHPNPPFFFLGFFFLFRRFVDRCHFTYEDDIGHDWWRRLKVFIAYYMEEVPVEKGRDLQVRKTSNK